MPPEVVERLAEIDNVIGIKEATGDVTRVEELKRRCGNQFILLSGDDPTACEFMLRGGHGVISVTANVVPSQIKALVDAATRGEREKAEQIDAQLRDLNNALFIESNPIPVKWALALMGKCSANYRLPLTPPSEDSQLVIERALNQLHLLK